MSWTMQEGLRRSRRVRSSVSPGLARRMVPRGMFVPGLLLVTIQATAQVTPLPLVLYSAFTDPDLFWGRIAMIWLFK